MKSEASKEITPKASPFLRWAGGKQSLVKTLITYLPKDLEDRRYVEPFLGAGSLFFAAAPKRAYLSDANQFLIQTFQQIRSDPSAVRRHLKGQIARHSCDHYYDTRNRYNATARDSAAQAARFLYLNMTCFNGIFRVNVKGKFNVPKGSKDKLTLPSLVELRAVATALQAAEIVTADYASTLAQVNVDDFVYLDPPYPALNETAYFTHYTADRFGAKAQEVLAQHVRELDNRGAKFLLSNADVAPIRKLYAGYKMISVSVKRYVNSNGNRLAARELIIHN